MKPRESVNVRVIVDRVISAFSIRDPGYEVARLFLKMESEVACIHIVREYDEATKRPRDCKPSDVHRVVRRWINGDDKCAKAVAVERDHQLFIISPFCPCADTVYHLETDRILTAVREKYKGSDTQERRIRCLTTLLHLGGHVGSYEKAGLEGLNVMMRGRLERAHWASCRI
jgi:hypothetical protein